jgi:peptide-methionine (S)-S-oxide reductase
MKKFLFITLPVILIAFISAYTLKQLSYDKSVKAINLTPVKGKAIAAFAEGCFWHTELVFESLLGVDSVISGYAGGHTENPSYSQVGTESTGHAEAVLIYYNPEIISYEELVKVYYLSHNPLQVNGQGNDIGSQYRSVAFYRNEQEKQSIEAAKLKSKGAVTEVSHLKAFYRAEQYHQDYISHHPTNGYVKNVSIPDFQEFKKKYKGALKY